MARLADLVIDARRIADDMGRIDQRLRSLAQQPLQPFLALDEGPAADVLAILLQQVETEAGKLLPAMLESRLERGEIRSALVVEGDDLAVDQRAVRGKGRRRIGDALELVGPVLTAARIDARALAGDGDQGSIAVIFQLRQPLAALRRACDEGCELHLAKARHRQCLAGFLRRLGLVGNILAGFAGEVGLLDDTAPGGDLRHRPSRRDALDELLQDVAARRLHALLAVLDHQPVLALLARAGLHAHQRPFAPEPLAFEPEDELALLQPRLEIADRLPEAAVPEHDRATAILAFRDDPLEAAIGEGMVLGPDGKPLLGRVVARPARHSPTLQHTLPFEAEIVVQPRRVMLLDDEGEAVAALLRRPGLVRLGGPGEVAPGAVFLEQLVDCRLRHLIASVSPSRRINPRPMRRFRAQRQKRPLSLNASSVARICSAAALTGAAASGATIMARL